MGPIHFEDLEPHRFEDLVRELIYDFKDWQSIEATGRAGSDDGFDIRAFEKSHTQAEVDEDEDEENKSVHPMEGNLWMVQCKREKELGPTKIHEIIEDGVDKANPVYGYILVAPVNFSKKSHDAFRAGLRERGVLEFHLWGKAQLEDMLLMPKNDRILFAFFGISLVSKKRSRTIEIRQIVANKNKLFTILADKTRSVFNEPVLFRDVNDRYYPYKKNYPDFEKSPRWKEHPIHSYHPLGILAHVHEYFAYLDLKARQWDFTPIVDLVYRRSESEEENEDESKLRRSVEEFWQHLSNQSQAKLLTDGLIQFEDILFIDGKGDSLYEFPHLYLDFRPKVGPFAGFHQYIMSRDGRQSIDIEEDKLERIKVFPAQFPKPTIGKVYKDRTVLLDDASLHALKYGNDFGNALYDHEGKYAFLKQRDVIKVHDAKDNTGDKFIEVTHRREIKGKELLDDENERDFLLKTIERQIGRPVDAADKIQVLEFRRVYPHQFEEQ